MNNDIKQFPIYKLLNGKLIKILWIKSTDDYNHSLYNLHHYIKKKQYEKNKQWYAERGIEQKLILLPIIVHEQVHNQAIKNLSDAEFEKVYKISRWELLFNKKQWRNGVYENRTGNDAFGCLSIENSRG